MFKKDNFFAGMTMTILVSVVALVLIILFVPLIYSGLNIGEPGTKLLLLTGIPGLILVRYYLKSLHFEKSGQGALLVVFLMLILWFAYFNSRIANFPTF